MKRGAQNPAEQASMIAPFGPGAAMWNQQTARQAPPAEPANDSFPRRFPAPGECGGRSAAAFFSGSGEDKEL
jgi:hypothetical protein